MPAERKWPFRHHYVHFLFLFVLQFLVFSFLARFFLPLIRLNFLLALAVFLFWTKENTWWDVGAFLGLGVLMDVFLFVPFGHFFFLAGMTLLFVVAWRELFSQTTTSLFSLFLVFPLVELVIEEILSMFIRGLCAPFEGIVAVKVLSIVLNMLFFRLLVLGGRYRDVG